MEIEHARNAAGVELCDAGRFAFFGGKWFWPCPLPGIHQVLGHETTPYAEPLLCDDHFEQIQAAGLVTDPNPLWRPRKKR